MFLFYLCVISSPEVEHSNKVDPVTDILLLTSDHSHLQNVFKDAFGTLSSISTGTSSFMHNDASGTERKVNNLLENPKFAAVQTDVPTHFEIADGLTSYATINTSEPIPTQLSYNIGTENIENGKDGETLNNTEMQLEESSLITEFENQGVDLYDLSQSNVTSFDIGMLDPETRVCSTKLTPLDSNSNAKIVSIENPVPPEIGKTLDSDDLFGTLALPAQWDNIISSLDTNLENGTQQPFEYFNSSRDEMVNEYNTFSENVVAAQRKSHTGDSNVLKTLTAEADICKCIDCKCTPTDNCHECSKGVHKSSPIIKSDSEKVNNTECSGGCCKSKPKLNRCQTTIIEQVQKCCGEEENNNKSEDPCCVVVCLKTISQLKEMLEMATHLAEKNNCAENFGTIRETTVTSAP